MEITTRHFPIVNEIAPDLLRRTEKWIDQYQIENEQSLHQSSSPEVPGCSIM